MGRRRNRRNDLIRRTLKGETLVPLADLFEIIHSRQHGQVQAIRTAMGQLGFESLIASRPSRELDLIVAMVIARIIEPTSKLATTRWWHTTTLPDAMGVADADADDLYGALDWLITRQAHIEKKLAARHLHTGGVVLYDLTSSYFEGTSSPLAARGYNRDGKIGKLQVNYGLLTDPRGRPIAVCMANSKFLRISNDSGSLLRWGHARSGCPVSPPAGDGRPARRTRRRPGRGG